MPDIYDKAIENAKAEGVENEFNAMFEAFVEDKKEKQAALTEKRIDLEVDKISLGEKEKKSFRDKKKLQKKEKEAQEVERKLDGFMDLENVEETAYNAARKRGNHLDKLGLLFSQKSKIGRHGQKKLKESRDSIKNLDKKGVPENVYFDPFGKVIVEDEDNDTRDASVKELNQDFLKRVEEQKKLMQKNDFEKKLYGKEEKEYVMVKIMKRNLAEDRENIDIRSISSDEKRKAAADYASSFDHTREYIKDFGEGVDIVPNKFEVVVAVDPPTDVYVDYNKDVTKNTPYVMKNLRARPDFYNILDRNVKKSSDYSEIVEKGRKDAEAAGLQYDSDKDPNIDILRAQIAHGIEDEQGHSFVRMVASKNGSAVHSYSFGFWPLVAIPGIGAVTMGVVRNPDPEAKNSTIIERRHDVSYANYLRAATKIRGTMGSQRTYSFLGYNCTSFAADIAKEAGVPIKKKDSGEYMMTFRSRKALIDSPYSLAKYVRAGHHGNAEDGENAMQEWTKLSLSERFDSNSLRSLKESLSNRVRAKNVAELPTLDGETEMVLFEHRDDTTGEVTEYDLTFAGELIEKGKGSARKDNVQVVLRGRILRDVMRKLVANPLFNKLYKKDSENTKSKEEYAEEFLKELLKYVIKVVDREEDEFYEAMKTVKTSDAQNAGDPIEKARENLIAKRRAELTKQFGVDSGMRFVMNACATEEGFKKALEVMNRGRNGGDDAEVSATPERYFGEEIPEALVAHKPRAEAIAEKLYGLFGASYDLFAGTIDLVVERLLEIVDFDANTITDIKDKCTLIAYASVLAPNVAKGLEAMENAGQCCNIIKNMEAHGVVDSFDMYDLYDMIVLSDVIKFSLPDSENEAEDDILDSKEASIPENEKDSVPETEKMEDSAEELKMYIPDAKEKEAEIFDKLKGSETAKRESKAAAKHILEVLGIETKKISFEKSCRVIAHTIVLDGDLYEASDYAKDEEAWRLLLKDIQEKFNEDNLKEGIVDILRDFMELGGVINLNDNEEEEYESGDDEEEKLIELFGSEDAAIEHAEKFIKDAWGICKKLETFTDFSDSGMVQHVIHFVGKAAVGFGIPIADIQGDRLPVFIACLMECDDLLAEEIRITDDGMAFLQALFKIQNMHKLVDEKTDAMFRFAWKVMCATL